MTPFIGKSTMNFTKTPYMTLGFTFDSITRQLRLPIVDQEKSPIVNQTVKQFQEFSYSFGSVDKYLEQMNSLESSEYPFVNGMFSNQQDTIDFYKSYFSGDCLLTVSQKEYTYWKKSVDPGSIVFTDEVQKIINEILPEVYDDHLYGLFIKEFGTHVSFQANFGGLIEAQLFLKSCVWNSIDLKTVIVESEKDLDQIITDTQHNRTSGNEVYIQHRELHTYDITGGDPRILCQKDCTNRIATFEKNPLVTSFTYFDYTILIEKPSIQANLQKAIGNYIENARLTRNKNLDKVHAEEKKAMDSPKPVVITLGDDWDFQLVESSPQHKTITFSIQQGPVVKNFKLERSDYQVRLSYNDGGKWHDGSWGDVNHPSVAVGVVWHSGKFIYSTDVYAFYNCERTGKDLKCVCPIFKI